MAASRREGGETRGRGRPAREPDLLPAGENYDAWRATHAPRLEVLLVELEAGEHAERDYLTRYDAAREAERAGVGVIEPAMPFVGIGGLLRMNPALIGLKAYGSAYQVWIEIASMILRDTDVGAIVRKIHPERLERSTRSGGQLQRDQDGDLVQQARKRLDRETRDAMRDFWVTYLTLTELPD